MTAERVLKQCTSAVVRFPNALSSRIARFLFLCPEQENRVAARASPLAGFYGPDIRDTFVVSGSWLLWVVARMIR